LTIKIVPNLTSGDTEAVDQATAAPVEGGMEVENTSSFSTSNLTVTEEVYKERISKLKKILIEGFDIDLTLNFLFKQSHTDISLLKVIKAATEGRSNVLHSATVVAHAYMNAGTTQDTFLRENLDWLGKANNWAKFTAVASIGVVHKGIRNNYKRNICDLFR
jgi:26S proteasome regulatory subunit N2